MPDQRPNILFIMTDQQRYDHLGCVNEVVKTPNLDAFARESVFFSRAYAPNPVCVPARAAIATGRFPSQFGVNNNEPCLPKKETTYMSMLRDAGYHTAVIGKQHFNGSPIDHGYVEEDIVDSHYPPGEIEPEGSEGDFKDSYVRFLYDEGFRRGDELYEPVDHIVNRWKEDVQYHVDSYIGDRTVKWLETGRPDETPWMLCASFPGPHGPIDGHGLPQEELYSLEEIDLPETNLETLRSMPDGYANLGNEDGSIAGHPIGKRLTEDHIRRIRRAWYANVSLIDQKIGSIIQTLKDAGEYHNTLIFFTTDHGDFTCDYNLVDKDHVLLDVLTHIPFIVKPPSSEFPGKIESSLISSIDLAATCLSAAGVSVPDDMQACDLTPYWQSTEDINDREYVYLEADGVRGLRTGRWKLVCREGKPHELYDMREDPREINNLFGEPECGDTGERLLRQLVDQMTELSPKSTFGTCD